MNSTIINCIRNQRTLELRYHGFSRIVESYAYGQNKGGDEILRCYQISGGSESGERAGWKLLKVGEIASLYAMKEVFSERPGYKRNDKAMSNIYEQLLSRSQ